MDMVKEVKDLNYAHDGESTYEECHRGISIFAVPHAAFLAQRQCCRDAEALAEASLTTVDNVKRSKETNVDLPQDYYQFQQLLANYCKYLKDMVGVSNFHRKKFIAIRCILQQRVAVFEDITPLKILHLAWAIFDDAHQFFKACLQWEEGGGIPRSDLKYVVNFLRTGRILPMEHCPVECFLGTRPLPPPVGGGGRAAPAQEEEEKFPKAQTPLTNPDMHPEITKAVDGLLTEFPQITITALMASPAKPLTYNDVRLVKPWK
mmetsp:Transcript_6386/g.18703  ORF Transcript_6386/g.18703 Transcript_6386/m.18703 type:complete len:262 (+) Transcript_6386:1510-2295(+)